MPIRGSRSCRTACRPCLAFRNFETTVIDASGASRPVMISGTPKFAADGTFEGYVGVGHDMPTRT